MGKDSKIEWTTHTFNPWWGCNHVSPGCDHCYAETFSRRVGKQVWGTDAPRRFFGEHHWNEARRWDRDSELNGVRQRVFCASMADVLEDRRDLDPWREKLWRLIEETRSLDWLLLTKRPQNFSRLAPWKDCWPDNVWVGTTVESPLLATKRIPFLLEVPARIRFLSCEPLLERLDLAEYLALRPGGLGIDWVIVGGESGAHARPMEADWARALVTQSRYAARPCFVKQLGSVWARANRIGGKADDPAHWPHDLRVRELPHPIAFASTIGSEAASP